jgi:broad specificity phosphatase PhoE
MTGIRIASPRPLNALPFVIILTISVMFAAAAASGNNHPSYSDYISARNTAEERYDNYDDQNNLFNKEEKEEVEDLEDSKMMFAVRVHFLRHGETEANTNHLVCGQSDSPLTKEGRNQAKAANRIIDKYAFWRRYTSDLERAHQTAKIILGIDDDLTEKNHSNGHESNDFLIMDERLRERAKGVREGLDKTLSYDEAMEIFRKKIIESGGDENTSDVDKEVPLLETEDQVWTRIKDWIQDVVNDAYEQYLQSGKRYYDVFAATHSGTIRIIVDRMVRKQIPIEMIREETDKDGIPMINRLKIPNTSITRIDIYPGMRGNNFISSNGEPLDIDIQSIKEDGNNHMRVFWKSKLIDFTSTLHLEDYKLDLQ